MEPNKDRGKLDEQARKRVEAVLQSELNAEGNQLERIKSIVQRELANEGVVTTTPVEGATTLARAANQIFIGIIMDGEPVGVYF